jgi:hypothetical protein
VAQAKHNSQTIAWFWDLRQRGLLELDPPYQRRSVWNQDYREYFIDTVLLEFPAPAIFLFESIAPEGVTTYSVVDGKQRLLSIFDFVRDIFPVGEKAQSESLRGKYFSHFDNATKSRFWSYQFTVAYLPTTDEGVINNIFDRINRNVAKLTAQELRHARFDGEFITVAESLAEWMPAQLGSAFPRITDSSRRQMKDVEFVASLLLLLDEGPKGYSVTELDAAFSDRDESWERRKEVESLFRETVSALRIHNAASGALIGQSRLRNQADFYSLFGAVASMLHEGSLPNAEPAAQRLLSFAATVENPESRANHQWALDYFNAARSASNDAGPRSARIEIIKRALQGVFE